MSNKFIFTPAYKGETIFWIRGGRPEIAQTFAFIISNRERRIGRMRRAMLTRTKYILGAFAFVFALATGSSAQSSGARSAQRAPSSPARAFVVLTAQSLDALETTLRTNNKPEDL